MSNVDDAIARSASRDAVRARDRHGSCAALGLVAGRVAAEGRVGTRHRPHRRGVLVDPAVAPSFEQRSARRGARRRRGSVRVARDRGTALELASCRTPCSARDHDTCSSVGRASPACAVIAAGCSSTTTSRDVRGIPVSTPARTIVDLSSRLDADASSAGSSTTRSGGALTTLGRTRSDRVARLGPAPGRSPQEDARSSSPAATPTSTDARARSRTSSFDALRRFRLPLPETQHPVRVDGPRAAHRLLLSASRRLALEPQGLRTASAGDRSSTPTRCAATSSSSRASASSSSRRRSPTG